MREQKTVIAAVIGRGHSGTRGISSWLEQAGFDVGRHAAEPGRVNGTQDYQHPSGYEAARVVGRHALYLGGNRWDHDHLLACPIDAEWRRLMDEYLATVYARPGLRSWKLPECTFSLPWILRVYPEVRAVIVHRDPRDVILKGHGTDDLTPWGLEWEPPRGTLPQRAVSWTYQTGLIAACARARPAQCLSFRLRDYVLDHDRVREAVSAFLGVPMPEGRTYRNAIGCWRHQPAGFYAGCEVLDPWLPCFDGDDAGPLSSI